MSWKQYIPRKRSRFALKCFVLYDAKTGYVWNSILYSDKDTDGIDYGNGKYHATHIVCYYQKIFSTKGIAFMLTTGILQLKFAKY